MQAKLSPLRAADGRLHPRRSVRLRASFRDPRCEAIDAFVIDLSDRGCRLDGAGAFEEGDRFLIKLPGLEAKPCRVAWVQQSEIGCEFDTPLFRGERELIHAQCGAARRAGPGIFGRRLRDLAGGNGGGDGC